MKAVFWFLLLIVAVLTGAIIFNFTRERAKQSGLVIFELSADSIRAYEKRVAELESKAELLRERMNRVGAIERTQLQRQLMKLSATISELKKVIEHWRVTHQPAVANNLYRQCILLYGKASGVCDLLLEDTISNSTR